MASTPTVEDLLQRNKIYAQMHSPQPLISERQTLGLPSPQTMIITCMDARVIPEKFMNLEHGEAFVLRNAGGRSSFALRDIIAIDIFVNLKNLIVIHHTDCGALHFDNEMIRGVLEERAPNHVDEVRKMEFGKIDDLTASIQEDVGVIRECPFIRKELSEQAQGLFFDIKTGVLNKVA